jgi:hypothetical protein
MYRSIRMVDHFNWKLETQSKPRLVKAQEQLDQTNHY